MTEAELALAMSTQPHIADRFQNLAHRWRAEAETAHVLTASLLLEHARQLEAEIYNTEPGADR